MTAQLTCLWAFNARFWKIIPWSSVNANNKYKININAVSMWSTQEIISLQPQLCMYRCPDALCKMIYAVLFQKRTTPLHSQKSIICTGGLWYNLVYCTILLPYTKKPSTELQNLIGQILNFLWWFLEHGYGIFDRDNELKIFMLRKKSVNTKQVSH